MTEQGGGGGICTGMFRDCPNGIRKYRTNIATGVLVVNASSSRALISRMLDNTSDHFTPITSMIMKPAWQYYIIAGFG
jgi:hypothetical protein